MASTPRFKVYSPAGEYIAACRYVDDAAVLVAFQGEGARVKLEHRRVLWTEGADGLASESYDAAAHVMLDRAAV